MGRLGGHGRGRLRRLVLVEGPCGGGGLWKGRRIRWHRGWGAGTRWARRATRAVSWGSAPRRAAARPPRGGGGGGCHRGAPVQESHAQPMVVVHRIAFRAASSTTSSQGGAASSCCRCLHGVEELLSSTPVATELRVLLLPFSREDAAGLSPTRGGYGRTRPSSGHGGSRHQRRRRQVGARHGGWASCGGDGSRRGQRAWVPIGSRAGDWEQGVDCCFIFRSRGVYDICLPSRLLTARPHLSGSD